MIRTFALCLAVATASSKDCSRDVTLGENTPGIEGECCGGDVPGRPADCAQGLTCNKPLSGGTGVCMPTSATPVPIAGTAQPVPPTSECVRMGYGSGPAGGVDGPGPGGHPDGGAPPVTSCGVEARCNGHDYKMDCDGTTCTCSLDGKAGDARLQGSICASADAMNRAADDCGFPPDGGPSGPGNPPPVGFACRIPVGSQSQESECCGGTAQGSGPFPVCVDGLFCFQPYASDPLGICLRAVPPSPAPGRVCMDPVPTRPPVPPQPAPDGGVATACRLSGYGSAHPSGDAGSGVGLDPCGEEARCPNHQYKVDCDATSCTCSIDGRQTASFPQPSICSLASLTGTDPTSCHFDLN